jgi:hypothetical protein
VGTVALVTDLFELHTVLAAGTTLDCALDVVRGHIHLARLLHCEAQPEIALDVRAAFARGDRQLARDLGEHLAATSIDDRFLVLDSSPLAVTGHGSSETNRRSDSSAAWSPV